MIDFACKQFRLDEIVKCALGLTKADFKVMKFLTERDEWIVTEDISRSLKFNLSTVQRAVKKLHEKEVIERKQENIEGGGYFYAYKAKPKPELGRIVMEIINNWVKQVDKGLEKW